MVRYEFALERSMPVTLQEDTQSGQSPDSSALGRRPHARETAARGIQKMHTTGSEIPVLAGAQYARY